MNRQVKKLTEQDLRRMVNSSVKQVLKEGVEDEMTMDDALSLLDEAYEQANELFNVVPRGMRMDLSSITLNIKNAIRIIKAKQGANRDYTRF